MGVCEAGGAQVSPLAENSQPEPAKKGRGKGKPFQKGKSGNPGGVPRETLEVKAIMQEHGSEMVRLLMESARGGNVQAQIRCVEYVLGKPKDLLEMTGKDGVPLAVSITLKGPR